MARHRLSADDWLAFERLAIRYDDPRELERDLDELVQLRQRVAELEREAGELDRLRARVGELEVDGGELTWLRQRVAELERGRRPEPSRPPPVPVDNDYLLHRVGWGVMWRLMAIGAVQLVWLPRIASWIALGVVVAFVVVGAWRFRLWSRRGLWGTLWRLGAASCLTLATVRLSTEIYVLTLGVAILVALGDLVWTVLWPNLPVPGREQPVARSRR
ncbi:MAG TPA: hypothetical protein VIA06_06895 [Candidatus Dormibacteraeota bacterium]|jgi:hypothetical protein|nr:hypothetical protein [Candidatus Dormibacteraeota bacterium]